MVLFIIVSLWAIITKRLDITKNIGFRGKPARVFGIILLALSFILTIPMRVLIMSVTPDVVLQQEFFSHFPGYVADFLVVLVAVLITNQVAPRGSRETHQRVQSIERQTRRSSRPKPFNWDNLILAFICCLFVSYVGVRHGFMGKALDLSSGLTFVNLLTFAAVGASFWGIIFCTYIALKQVFSKVPSSR